MVFCDSSKIIKAFDRVLPLINANGAISIKPDSIFFIDSNSIDQTKEILSSNFDVISIDTEDFDHGGTRSLVQKICNSEVVLYLTQDALPLCIESIEKLVSIFKDQSIGAAYGRQLPYAETNLFGKHLREFNYSNESFIRQFGDKSLFGIKTPFISNSFAAYRRLAMDEIGWFKDGLILGEDIYAGAKLLQVGYKLAYVADAQVYHSHSYNIFEECKRYFDIGAFHKMESWILDEFGKAEGESMRYIKSEYCYLIKHKAYLKLPEFLIRNGMKFLGYMLGNNYKALPKSVIKKLSMHYRWWDKYWSGCLVAK